MPSTPPLEGPEPLDHRPAVRWAAGALVLAALLVYANSLFAPFIFDDGPAIIDNTTIRKPWSLEVLSPPGDGNGVEGRPLINLTLAFNYALGGTEVWGYHLFNILIHAAAGLALFGIVRRTLLRPALAARWGPAALPLALAIAALWLLHPLQTESVTCVIQRTGVVMGLLYLLTLYAFVRGVEPGAANPRRWLGLAVVCCLLGMVAKEDMVTAPLAVLLYDRTFVAGTFREAWRRRRGFYPALAGTWLLLVWSVWHYGGHRGNAAGFGLGTTPWTYVLTQCYAVVLYLRLSLWPHPLILDYGYSMVKDPWTVVPQALILFVLLGNALFALWRGAATGFVRAFFFLVLAPTSSVLPLVSQPVAEHRMYLPLAAIVTLAALGLHAWLGRRSFVLLGLVALILGALTLRRNWDYRSRMALWNDNIANLPGNARAYDNLARTFAGEGRLDRVVENLQTAVRVDPNYMPAQNDLGAYLLMQGRIPEAIKRLRVATKVDPRNLRTFNNLAFALMQTGQTDEAIAELRQALRLKPDDAITHNNLGMALAREGQLTEAGREFLEALRLEPGFAEARRNLANLVGKNTFKTEWAKDRIDR